MADATVTFAAKDLNLGSTIDKLKKELGATQDAAKNASKGFDMSFGKIGLAAGVAGAAVKAGMMAVEAATEKGILSKTFRCNAAMAGLNLAHGAAIIAEEIAHQNEQQIIEKEIEKCRDSKPFYSEQVLLF